MSLTKLGIVGKLVISESIFFNEYAEYATKFFDFVSKNRIEGHDVKIVDVNEEDTEVSDADLPF